MEMQPPLIPLVGGVGQQANPWFTVANQFIPRNLHDVIRWARYITLQSPTTSEVIRKLATYPITDFLYDTEQPALKKRYEALTSSFKLKEILSDIGFEFFTIGNVFLSVYFPIFRQLECPSCKTKHTAKGANWATFKQWNFHGTCPVPTCGYKGIFTRLDTKSLAVEDMNVIKWVPEHIAVNHNPITGESEYYYRIPNSIKQKIQKGDRLFVDSVPWSMIEAVRHNQDFKFDKGNLFHLKNVSSGGTVEGISVPPLLSLFSLVFYQAVLRKANESIALEYLSPMRVIFPQAQTANSDPVTAMSLRNFRSNMEDALRRHKTDKNHIVISPAPVGYQALSGEGKNLLVAQELAQAEETILLSLGVSRELLSGTTNWTSSSVGLRMLENLLNSYVSRLTDFIDWMYTRAAAYLNMEKVKITMTPFKLLDDDSFKGLLGQLAGAAQASQQTLFEELGLDWDKEQERLKDEAVQRARLQIETQYETENQQFIAARKAGEQMADNNEYQTQLTKAQGLAERLMQADETVRRQTMNDLKVQDYGTYLMVAKLIADAQKADDRQNEAQANAQAAVSPEDDQAVQGAANPSPGGAPGPQPPADQPSPT